MSQYLLLRDNKQSGPYTFEELTAKGLKGYDLIWIEGKSAAWRYPSEIAEFKPFAPVVEEQPYDRFYKRQTTTVKKQPDVASNTNTVSQPVAPKVPVDNTTETPQTKKTYNQPPAGNRRVVVILPGGMRENTGERVIFNETVENKIAQPDKKAVMKEIVPAVQPDKVAQRPDPALMDFRKEPDNLLHSRPDKKRSASSKTPKVVAATVFLLTVGILIGWAFSHSFTWNKPETAIVTPKEIVDIPASQSVFNNEGSQSVENQIGAPEENLVDDNLANQNQAAADSIALTAPAETAAVKKAMLKTKKPVVTPVVQQASLPVSQPAEPVTASNTAVTNDNDESEKKLVKKNINELIKVASNDFKVGAFGGISNLKLKVTNSSPYPVDLVVVEVKYLLANKKEFKTENVYFKNLSAGGSNTIEVPKSSRGIEVSTKVALITSKALGMYQASL